MNQQCEIDSIKQWTIICSYKVSVFVCGNKISDHNWNINYFHIVDNKLNGVMSTTNHIFAN